MTLAAPASAFAANQGEHGKAATPHSHRHHGKPASHRFTATGIFDGADASGLTFTMDDKGGSKDLHGKLALVITVSSKTRVTRDDAPATLTQLVKGDHVAVNGLRGLNGELDALHVNADSTPEPQPSPTDSPAPTDTATPATSTTG